MRFLIFVFKGLLYAALGAVLLIAGAAFFFMTWEPDRTRFPLRGIDVSHHQGPIEWAKVSQDDVAFVYMKASEGGDFQDQAFETNWRGAGAAGLARGAYHFFSLCRPGAIQAENFLSVLPASDEMLPPVLDLEFSGNCARRPPVEAVLTEITAFISKVEQASGKPVVIYAPSETYTAYLKDQGLTREVWVRSIWRSPGYVKDWLFWQYHQRGSVAGIKADVDLNVLARGKSLEALMN